MAAVIGDSSLHFHNMIANPALAHQHQQHSHHDSHYHSSSALHRRASNTSATRSQRSQPRDSSRPNLDQHPAPAEGAARFPTPPSSSSPGHASANTPAHDAKDGDDVSMAPQVIDTAQAARTTGAVPPSLTSTSHQQPSPAPDNYPVTAASVAATTSITTPIAAEGSYQIGDASSPKSQSQTQIIKVRDLAHIQNLVRADVLAGNGSGILNETSSQQVKYEISGMPIGDVIEMVAALLTKITTTNDLQHDALQRNVAHQQQANQNSESGPQMSPLSTSVLAFHGKNIPAITILSYLSRIHKYCPTTFEVFLSLLVYFDRMTERVNEMVVKGEEAKRQPAPESRPSTTSSADVEMHETDAGIDHDESDSDLADDDDDDQPSHRTSRRTSHSAGPVITGTDMMSPAGPATYFVVDNFNIHRLVIAGVTCASKFFSDVFYTNSRYAKVGGLPLAELNHLEIQFLLLNDFRLAVPVEDLEAYATMLVEFYAREVIVPQSRQQMPADA